MNIIEELVQERKHEATSKEIFQKTMCILDTFRGGPYVMGKRRYSKHGIQIQQKNFGLDKTLVIKWKRQIVYEERRAQYGSSVKVYRPDINGWYDRFTGLYEGALQTQLNEKRREAYLRYGI